MAETILINIGGCVAGRVAAFAAKKALQGNKVIIFNSEKAVIIGKKKDILERYKHKFSLGRDPQKGPHFHRVSDKVMRRIIRGMLPRKKTKGREALKRVLCFRGIPEKFVEKEKEMKIIAKADAINFLTLHDICKLLGKEK